MTPRSIRRAAERKALKAARKAATPDNHTQEEPTCGEARLLANRANAQLSTGPRTSEGKSISSLDAVKTGLTGRTVVLPTDDAAIYQRHILDYESEYQPEGLRERELVQSLADTAWRLQRIPRLEAALYAQGYLDFENAFEDHHPDLRRGMIELQAHLKYEKQLRNLQLQENRLHRRYEKEMAELRNLQKEREAKEEPLPTFVNEAQTEPRTSVSGGFEFAIGVPNSTPDSILEREAFLIPEKQSAGA